MSILPFSRYLLKLMLLLTVPALADSLLSNCRCIPGDKCWPSSQKWSQLNATINGRLVAANPLPRVCHKPNYNQTACAALAAVWKLPQTHYPNPVEITSPYWQNESCSPFTDPSSSCVLGNYVSYTINVSSAADVAAGLDFAHKNNIRLVIKNTGHDYLGKSTGLGSLGLWTHNLDTIEFLNYSSLGYNGSAIKMGAGVLAFNVYEEAAAKGLRVVGGECSTVGLAGGYLQGGGHSALSSTYGMGADQVLEWEVVIANGTHLTASPQINNDLYWALSGGGGGTYGVVLSVTIKAFEDGPVAGASVEFNRPGFGASDEPFWNAIEQLYSQLPGIVDTGATVLTWLTNDSFNIGPLTAPGKTEEEVVDLLKPWTKTLQLPFVMNTTLFPTYLEHFNNYLGPLPFGSPLINIIDVSLAGRMIPRSVVENPSLNAGLTEALKLSVSPEGGGFMTGGVALNAAHSVAGNRPSSNSVLPQWRDTILTFLAFSPWDYKGSFQRNVDAESYLIDVTVPAMKAVAPNGGAYLNEANRRQEDWKESFYGINYDRLLSIKKAYDPEDLFYAVAAVGSDAWIPDSSGRLCRSKV
ncbi:putative isoamyl alcohol oxidase [Xylaria flabelliformis]|nr:putative isoamyl alcohol oxidase [Xylaria flabelliformis]